MSHQVSYVDSFSFEWANHSQTQLDSISGLDIAEKVFFERTGFKREDLEGKVILDAGCGIGRFMEIVKKYGGIPVGIDMSSSVEQAVRNVDAGCVQGDILSSPFEEKSFDKIYSLGVLHHTRDTRKAFDSLVPLLKDGGEIAVWVYSAEGWKQKIYNAVTGFYRIFTTRMKQGNLYRLSRISVGLYHVHKLPIVGVVSRTLLPTSMEPLEEWRVLDTFDWYSPKYQTKHTYKEVERWFIEAGLKEINRLSFPVSVSGRK